MRDRGVANAPNCYCCLSLGVLASAEPVLERSVPANKRRWQLDFFKSIPPSTQLGTDIDVCVKRAQKFARGETHLAAQRSIGSSVSAPTIHIASKAGLSIVGWGSCSPTRATGKSLGFLAAALLPPTY